MGKEKKRYPCSICNKSFSIKSIKEPQICQTCNNEFSCKKTLKRHIERVHDGNKPIFCTKCDISFTSKIDLKQHTKAVHNEVRTYPCLECVDSHFASKYLLDKHVDSVHKSPSQSAHLC